MVLDTVERSRAHTGWPIRRVLGLLGVKGSTYYKWRRGGIKKLRARPVHKVLEGERRAVIAYALRHPRLRHRELAWRMVDEDVAYLSPSTVYRILRDKGLLRGWDRRKEQRERREAERASRPDERWQTDICYIGGKDRKYYLVIFVDEYSRYLVHAEVMLSMAGDTVSLSAQEAIDKLDSDVRPDIQSDNGSAYVSRDFKVVLSQNGIGHHRIHPHCPEENGIAERVHRTVKERLSETEQESLAQIQEEVEKIRRWYNERRLHSALHFLRPVDYYRGDPEKLLKERQRKLTAARHARREANLDRKQRTFDLEGFRHGEATTYRKPDLSNFV